jgi:hypothetical protein
MRRRSRSVRNPSTTTTTASSDTDPGSALLVILGVAVAGGVIYWLYSSSQAAAAQAVTTQPALPISPPTTMTPGSVTVGPELGAPAPVIANPWGGAPVTPKLVSPSREAETIAALKA